jgi:ATP-dependent 26S proteasome regulatory subunit
MGAGKTLAVRAIQTECNALVFDLTPSNLEDRFDKTAMKKLIWTVIIAAKEFQPSIVLID